MVHIRDVESANLLLVKSQPLVAVFVGGTSGIGEYTVHALARTHANVGKGLRVYIVGRNAAAAQKIIHECEKTCPSGRFVFVEAADLSLIRNVDNVCQKLSEYEGKEDYPRIDILVMSQACPPWRSAKETVEGLDTFMSLTYYSRMRITTKLLSLLKASATTAHVISVYAGGYEAKLLIDDLPLRRPGNYSLAQARSHIAFMTTLYMEDLSKQHQDKLSLIHVFPGLVITPAFDDPQMPTFFKLLWQFVGKYLARFYAVPADECGARILALASSERYPGRLPNIANPSPSEQAREKSSKTAFGTDGSYGSGAYAINWNGESTDVTKAYQQHDKAKLSERVLEHTRNVFESIETAQRITS